MKKVLFACVLISVWLMPAVAWGLVAADLELFEQANRAYRNEKYGQAAQVYAELADRLPGSAVVYYNLGNSHFRLNELGPALLAYEKAHLRAPRDKDIVENLNYARGLLEYRIEDKRNWYVRTGEAVLEKFTEREIGFLGALCYFLFMASWCFAVFFRPGAPWGWVRRTLIVLMVLIVGLTAVKRVETRLFRDAIVMRPETEVRFGPSESDQVAFRLSEGIKVYVVDRRKAWSRIGLVNGEGGWIQNSRITEVMG